MSQRSHIAQSGSSAIRECSAACSEPSSRRCESRSSVIHGSGTNQIASVSNSVCGRRSEEHTSELQSRLHLVCRLLLEKKKPTKSSNLSETAEVPACNVPSRSPLPALAIAP